MVYDTGNKLLAVTDTGNTTFGFKEGITIGDEYAYDANGNLITDRNKQITSILYNHLNLPTEVIFENSVSKKIEYAYDASGNKLKKTIINGGAIMTIEYIRWYTVQKWRIRISTTLGRVCRARR